VFSLFFSNWLTSILGVMLVRPFAWLTVAPVRLLTPVLAVITVAGAFVTALALGELIETNFTISSQLHQLGRVFFWERPITLAFIGLTFASLYWMRPRQLKRGR
jgi:TctA family transporter